MMKRTVKSSKANFSLCHQVLYRETEGRVRYYAIRVYKTLFGGYLLEKSYGSLNNKRATGVIKEHYENIELTLLAVTKTLSLKLKRGYSREKLEMRA